MNDIKEVRWMRMYRKSLSFPSRFLNLFMVIIIISSLVFPLFFIKSHEINESQSPHLSYWHNGDDPAVSIRKSQTTKYFSAVAVFLYALLFCILFRHVTAICNSAFKPHFFQRRRRLLLLPLKFTSNYVFPSKYCVL